MHQETAIAGYRKKGMPPLVASIGEATAHFATRHAPNPTMAAADL
jgi:hypothetical protein